MGIVGAVPPGEQGHKVTVEEGDATSLFTPWGPWDKMLPSLGSLLPEEGGNPQDEMILGVPEVQQAAWGWWLGRVSASLAPSGTWR